MKRAERQLAKATGRFFKQLTGKSVESCLDKTETEIAALTTGAFRLYQEAWNTYNLWDITRWEWPANELSEPTPFAHGNEPWTVLLREAVRLSTTSVSHSLRKDRDR